MDGRCDPDRHHLYEIHHVGRKQELVPVYERQQQQSDPPPRRHCTPIGPAGRRRGYHGAEAGEIVTILGHTGTGKSRLFEDVTAIVERCLFRIALQRSQNVKSRAADYLGINRNTFQKKMSKLGID